MEIFPRPTRAAQRLAGAAWREEVQKPKLTFGSNREHVLQVSYMRFWAVAVPPREHVNKKRKRRERGMEMILINLMLLGYGIILVSSLRGCGFYM